MVAPWKAVPEVRERPPSTQKTLTAGPLGDGAGGPGAPTNNTKNVDGGPPRKRCRRSRSVHHQRKNVNEGPLGGSARGPGAPTINAKNVNGGPLGGGAGGQGAPTINVKNVDGGPPGRQCWRSGSAVTPGF
jgi:hypothetical protein